MRCTRRWERTHIWDLDTLLTLSPPVLSHLTTRRSQLTHLLQGALEPPPFPTPTPGSRLRPEPRRWSRSVETLTARTVKSRCRVLSSPRPAPPVARNVTTKRLGRTPVCPPAWQDYQLWEDPYLSCPSHPHREVFHPPVLPRCTWLHLSILTLSGSCPATTASRTCATGLQAVTTVGSVFPILRNFCST